MKNYGIIGYPLEHSFSPIIHNIAFKHYNMLAEYGKIEIENNLFNKKINEIKKGNWSGFNVTIPYKQQIIPHLDELDRICERIGAVNTIKVNKDNSWKGFNTDYIGFIKPIRYALGKISNCLLIGAGGAAQAVGFGLLEFSEIKHLVIVNRTSHRSEALEKKLRSFKPIEYEIIDYSDINSISERFDLIVNTTSVGMDKLKDQSPINLQQISGSDSIIYDLIYNPAKTVFLREAEQLDLNIINGLPMLIGQAEESFKIWTGKNFTDTIYKEIELTLS